MKRTKILYWTFTGVFAAFMFVFAVPDIVSSQIAIDGFNKMGMPIYLLPFLGIAKTLGVIAILIPGYPRLKEWAYAGLVFDLIGATYCILFTSSPGETVAGLVFMSIPIALGILSYLYYHINRSVHLQAPATYDAKIH
ncbi:MAG TPA: DoxX family protein [Flavitalea sp.]|nr:DoxX family protein [Flavitalea sp.]